MEQIAGLIPSRRNEDIALDMMKFIAGTTGYGKTGAPGAGFQGGTVNKAEDYAADIMRKRDTEDPISRQFHGGMYTPMGFDGDIARIE